MTQADFDGRGQLKALVDAIGPEEPPLGAAAADPGEALREALLTPRRLLFGLPTPFVGRREALERVYDAVRDAARGGRLGLIRVTGAPGLGKTRLLAEALAIIAPEERGFGVLPVLAEATDGAESIIAKLVRRRFGITPFEREQEAWERIVADTAAYAASRQFGTLSRALGFLAGLRASGPDALALGPDVETFRRQAEKAFTEFLRADLRRSPQILVVGRAHLLSQEAAAAVEKIIDDLRETPLIAMFIADSAVARDEAPDGSVEVEVSPLEDREIERYLRSVEAEEPFPEWVAQPIVAHAAGSPRLAEFNLRLLVQRGVLKVGPDGLEVATDRARFEAALGKAPLARDLEEAAGLRVGALAPEAHLALTAAALVGNRFEREVVEAMAAGLSLLRDQPLPQTLGPILDACEHYGLITAEQRDAAGHGPSAGHYRFAHDSDRLRLLEILGEGDRAVADALAAQWLEAHTARGDGSNGATWERIAGHWLGAGREAEAASALREAALCARRGLSLHRARALFRKALLVLGLGGPQGEAVLLSHARTAAPVIAQFGRLSNETGDFQMALPLFEAALALSRIIGDRGGEGDACFGLGFAHRGLGHYALSRGALEAAQSIYRAIHQPDGIAGCLVQLARLDWLEGSPRQRAGAVRRCDEALLIRRRLGEPRALAETLNHLATIHIQRGDHDAARELLVEARGLYRDVSDLAGEARSLVALGALSFYACDYLQAIGIWRDALALAERAGERDLISTLLNNLGEALIEVGDLGRAQAALDEARELAEDGGDPRILIDVLKNLTVLHARGGAHDEAARTLATAREEAARLEIPSFDALLKRAEGLALMLAPRSAESRGQAERAMALFDEALEAFTTLDDPLEQERTRIVIEEFQHRLPN